MNGKSRHAARVPAVVRKAEKALQIAVAKTIEDHRRSGDPIVVWKHGRVMTIPASRIRTGRRRATRG